MITREMVRDWLLAYLNGEIDQEALVSWARQVRRGGEVFAQDMEAVSRAVARIGLIGARGCGLAFEDCVALLKALGYAPRVVADPFEDEGDEDCAED